jgi:hypothetical protein
MKRIILILALCLIGFGSFGQTILKVWTIDLSTVSSTATDTTLYWPSNEDYNYVSFQTEQIGIARTCIDTIITRIGWSDSQTGFNEYNSVNFPYTLVAADSSYANGDYFLRKGDHGDGGPSTVVYFAVQIDFNGSTCREGIWTCTLVQKKQNRYYILTR